MLEKIEELKQQFSQQLDSASSSPEAEAVQVRFLGRKGPIQALMKELRDVPAEERPQVGKWINDLKQFVSQHCTARLEELRASEETTQLAQEELDVTLPGRREMLGRRHLLSRPCAPA